MTVGDGAATGDRELGAGSVFMVSIVMAVMVALAAAGALAGGYQARHQAAAAADLAAIAAAKQLDIAGSEPCAMAERVAVANGGELRDCLVDGEEVEVQVRVGVTLGPEWLPDQYRRARAGPQR